MPYNPLELAPKDVIRGWAGDTSNDVESEIVPDETYLAVLARYGADSAEGAASDTAPFYRAAADMLRRVAVKLQADPTSISAPSDGSIGWGGNRTKALELKAAELDAKAAEIEADEAEGSWNVVTVRSDFLTGSDWGDTW